MPFLHLPPQTPKFSRFFFFLEEGPLFGKWVCHFCMEATINPLSILSILIDELCGLGFFLTSDFFRA